MKPTAISLFCGAGGCSLGFEQAGYSILYATDKDKAAVETYKKNFPTTNCSQEDINNLNFSDILKNIGLKKGELDILIGGPPCQGFSTAGTRFWDDPRNHLLRSYVKSLEIIQPKWFLMENVEGLLTSNKGTYIQEVIKAFVELGYNVRLEKVYSQEYGVPQRRKRVLIIGNRLDIDFEMPQAIYKASGKIFRNTDITVNDVLQGLPEAVTEKEKLQQYPRSEKSEFEKNIRGSASLVSDNFFPKLNDVQLARISALKPGQTMKDLPEHLQHESYKKRANRRVSDGTPSAKRGGAPSGLKRLKQDEPCLTITSAATRELIHPTENRPLTIRECARIQTFPDSFIFIGNSSQKIQQIGNAIPPLLAKIFAENIKNNYGFSGKNTKEGKLLGYVLTKAGAMSPALKKTDLLLHTIVSNKTTHQQIFKELYG